MQWLAVAWVCVITALPATRARAADPQSYRVELASTGDAKLDSTLKASSNLVALRERAPVSPFGLIARARTDLDRLKTALESAGYYASSIAITIDGKALGEPGLADALRALPAKQDARVAVTFTLGPLYHLGSIKLEGETPPGSEKMLGLQEGSPAVAAEVLAAGARLLTDLQDEGYALAKVDPPVAYEDAQEPVLDVSFHVIAGPKVNIGRIHIEGLRHVHESVVWRRLLLHTGELYDARRVEAARQDLLRTQVFAGVTVRLGSAVDSTGGIPVTFVVQERLRHALSFNGAFSTDLGGSLGVTWTNRNLLGNGEQLTVAASALNLGGGDTTGVGYDTSVKFIEPDFGHRDQQLQIAVGAVRQFLIAYDQSAINASASLNRKLSSVWSASAGLSASEEHVLQAGTNYNYTLIGAPIGVTYDSTNLRSPLDDPTHGMRDSVTLTPTRSLGHPSANFLITQLRLAAYFDLDALFRQGSGRTVIAARALTGIAQGAGEFSLPPDQRFYGGGSGTIRGYPYQGVGPEVSVCNISSSTHQLECPVSNIPIGGTSFVAASIELRQRLFGNWGAAVFFDEGRVSSNLTPPATAVGSTPTPVYSGLSQTFYAGVGAGVRYYTPIGPVRLDVGVPTRIYTRDGARFQVYIGLGQAF
jgi:translocation and assembly module TamA